MRMTPWAYWRTRSPAQLHVAVVIATTVWRRWGVRLQLVGGGADHCWCAACLARTTRVSSVGDINSGECECSKTDGLSPLRDCGSVGGWLTVPISKGGGRVFDDQGLTQNGHRGGEPFLPTTIVEVLNTFSTHHNGRA